MSAIAADIEQSVDPVCGMTVKSGSPAARAIHEGREYLFCLQRGRPLMTLHAQARGELDYALRWLGAHPRVIEVKESIPAGA